MSDSNEKQQKPHRSQPGQCVKKNPEKKLPHKNDECLQEEIEAKSRDAAAVICGSEFAACRVISAAAGKEDFFTTVDIVTLVKIIRDQVSAVQGGNMSHVEAMLMNQATALQNLFVRLVERGMSQTKIPNMEGFMKLALRSQNQCRATLETLATIKNPPVVYARQANFANGPQQVNNGKEIPRVREDKNEQNQLMEVAPNERMDFGTTKTAGGTHQELATVGKIDRAADRERKTGERKTRL